TEQRRAGLGARPPGGDQAGDLGGGGERSARCFGPARLTAGAPHPGPRDDLAPAPPWHLGRSWAIPVGALGRVVRPAPMHAVVPALIHRSGPSYARRSSARRWCVSG